MIPNRATHHTYTLPFQFVTTSTLDVNLQGWVVAEKNSESVALPCFLLFRGLENILHVLFNMQKSSMENGNAPKIQSLIYRQ